MRDDESEEREERGEDEEGEEYGRVRRAGRTGDGRPQAGDRDRGRREHGGAGEGEAAQRLRAVGDAGGWWDGASLKALLERIDWLQHPHTCNARSSLVMSWDNTGLSAIVFFMSGLLEVAAALGRAMVPSEGISFVFGACEARNFECIFRPWSACSAILARRHGGDRLERGSVAPRAERGGGHFAVAAQEAEDMVKVPELPFERLAAKGRLWKRMALVRYLFRLNQRTARSLRIRELRDALGLNEPFIAWHVRLHVQDELRLGRAPSLEHHLEAVRMMAALYNLSTVFIATDDSTLAERAAALCPELTMRWYGGFNRSKLEECGGKPSDCWLEGRLARGDLDPAHITDGWLIDVKLLSFGHAFVGQWGSNLSRLAYLLAADRRRSLLPYISLDGPWRFSHLPMGLFA